MRLLRATREHPDVLVGASPRAMLSMFRCIQATALVDSMTAAAPRHVSDLFEPCIAHRLRFRPGTDEAAVVSEILESVEKPDEPEQHAATIADDPDYGFGLRYAG